MTQPFQATPDFADGDLFLERLKTTLGRRHRRRTIGTTVASVLTAAWLLVVSSVALQLQVDEDIWDSYLLSQDEQAAWLVVEEEVLLEIYMENLFQETDLDVLLGELIAFYGDDTWIRDIKLEP